MEHSCYFNFGDYFESIINIPAVLKIDCWSLWHFNIQHFEHSTFNISVFLCTSYFFNHAFSFWEIPQCFWKMLYISVNCKLWNTCSGTQQIKTLRSKLARIWISLYSSVSKISHHSFSFKQITKVCQQVNITIKWRTTCTSGGQAFLNFCLFPFPQYLEF